MKVKEYIAESKRTSRINWAAVTGSDVAALGLVGCLGGIASVLKKKVRDGKGYVSFKKDFEEKLGDLLWYVVSIANHKGIKLEDWPQLEQTNQELNSLVFELNRTVQELVTIIEVKAENRIEKEQVTCVSAAIKNISQLARNAGSCVEEIAKSNVFKNLEYWGQFHNVPAPQFDTKLPLFEQLPRKLVVDFVKINDKSLLIMINGVAIGDRLTDNSNFDDGYRYHDVFHIAGVACLGWSPVFRRMLKRKRKSQPKIDEVEDGARAAIIEEAVINHIYDYARSSNYLKGIKRIDSSLLKRLQSLVKNYEVESCELWEWEKYILEGYRVFRELREKQNGRLMIDAEKREIQIVELPPLGNIFPN